MLNKLIALFFGFLCITASALSSHIMGAGIWFWIIIVVGIFVAASQFFPSLKRIGAGVAGLLGLTLIGAVLLGLLAATVGGSFKLEEKEAMLLMLFSLIALFGLTLAANSKKPL